ncbi:MAG: carbon storage regulator CsrA [Spirochaetota bacterium]
MLILSRKTNERIIIGEDIEIAIVDIRGDQVKIGIVAPKNVKVYRQEVFDAIQEENRKAARAATDGLPSWEGLIPEDPTGDPF